MFDEIVRLMNYYDLLFSENTSTLSSFEEYVAFT